MHTTWIYNVSVAVVLAVCGLASDLEAQSITWQPVGRHDGGSITGLYATGPTAIMAQSRDHGLYSSTDKGATWQQFFYDAQHSTTFLGGGNGMPLFIHEDGIGNLRSTDNGAHWSHVENLPEGGTVFAVNGAGLFSGVSGDIWHSLDEGVSWARIYSTGLKGSVSFAAGSDGRIYAAFASGTMQGATKNTATGGDGGLFCTIDGGATWTRLATQNLPSQNFPAVAVGSDGTLYLGVDSYGLFRSTDHGATWFKSLICEHPRAILTSGYQTLVIDRLMFYLSWDLGKGWGGYPCLSGMSLLCGTMDANGSVLFGTVDHGVFRLGASQNLLSSSHGLDAMVIGGMQVESDGALVARTGDLAYRSLDEGAHWKDFDANQSRTVLACVTSGGAMLSLQDSTVLLRSFDSNSWQTVGYSYGSPSSPFRGVAAGSNHDAYAIVSPDRIIHSTDDGGTWENFGLTEFGTDGQPRCLCVDGDRLLVGTEKGSVVEYSIASKAEIAWHNIGREIDEIYRSPDGSLFLRGRTSGVMRSVDHGITWTPAQPEIDPAGHVFSQLFFDRFGNIFLGTDLGIFLSRDGGHTWSAENAGLPGSSGGGYLIARGASSTVYAAGRDGLYKGVLAGAAVKEPEIAAAITVEEVRPNPTAGNAVLRLHLDREESASLRIVDLSGKELLSIDLGRLGAGEHELPIDASALPAGAYLCNVGIGAAERSLPLVIAR